MSLLFVSIVIIINIIIIMIIIIIIIIIYDLFNWNSIALPDTSVRYGIATAKVLNADNELNTYVIAFYSPQGFSFRAFWNKMIRS